MKKKLTLSKNTIKKLTVKTRVKAGGVEPSPFRTLGCMVQTVGCNIQTLGCFASIGMSGL